MKKSLKHFLLSAAIVTSLVGTSSSAFAAGTAHEPDSYHNANWFSGVGDYFVGTIVNNNGMETDYFRYKNNTGQPQQFYLNFDSQDRNLNYGLSAVGTSGNIGTQAIFIKEDLGREVWLVYLQPGAELDAYVRSDTYAAFDPTKNYFIALSTSPWF